MSFILDALKKSETERQQQASAEFATIPAGRDNPGLPKWLWVLGFLLAINLAVLLAFALRPDEQPAVVAVPFMAASEPLAAPSFAEQLEVARSNAPPSQPARASVDPVDNATTMRTTQLPAATRPAGSTTNTATLPTFHEVVANGSIDLPDLHLDIHVYSDAPEDRFVFINMSKQREQSRLSEGPVVTEIAPDGVILEYHGTRFLLPRD